MTVAIPTKPGDLLHSPDLSIWPQEREIASRPADRLDLRELAAEPLGDPRERGIEHLIAGDPVGCGDPMCPTHYQEWLSPDIGVLAHEKGFGNRHPGREGGSLHSEFLLERQACRYAGRRGAQDETLVAVEYAARETCVEASSFPGGRHPRAVPAW
jgi:hypothetical protein